MMHTYCFIILLIVFTNEGHVYNSIDEDFENATRTARILYPNYYNDYGGNDILYRPATTLEEERFDFIVVGSGSSGAVIANRLSEVPEWKILLLEVGEEATFVTDIPVIAPMFQFTNYNWNYLMERQDNMCLGFEGQRMAWPRGRALGGTTIINYMIYVRGNKLDYNRWAAMGNPGWSYDEVLPYFKKAEDSHVAFTDTGYRNSGGYMTVTDVPYRSESAHAFIRGAQEVGYKYVDYNGREQLGVSYVQASLRNGKRCSTEKAYLRPVRNRPNLKILTKARAVKVLIDPTTKTAYGIQYIQNKNYHTALAQKEVILSAGAFNSPQLLMLSGIGPKNHLEELGIPLLQDLPVGEKLYDHLTFFGQVFTVNESIVTKQEEIMDPRNFFNFILRGEGPLTSLGGVEALAYFKSNVSRDPGPYPDIEFIFVGGSLATDKGLYYRRTFRLTDEVYNAVYRPIENLPNWSLIPMLVHPKSYGHLKLKSKNPYHWPKFYGNFFTDPNNEDVKTFIAAIREAQRIALSPSMQRYGSKLVTNKIPGCEQHIFNSDDYWECALRHLSTTLHHQVATCKMGPPNDPEAVVDNKCRVYGIKKLRVADSSIIPIPPTAHTNAPAIMVGEKVSDLIKQDWLEIKGKISPKDIRRNVDRFIS